MEDNTRKCPNCSQKYTLKQQSPSTKSNFPLFLLCGHSMCENCIRNIVKFSEPVECKVCQHETIVEASKIALFHNDRKKLYELFPINYPMVGELTVSLEYATNQPSNEEEDCFVDLYAILKEGDTKNVECVECHRPTKKMCEQCNTNMCDICFTKSHKNFVVFKNHELKDIDEMVSPAICKIHKAKILDYYCKDCKKGKCIDCLMVGGEKSCKNHNSVSMQEINGNFLDELSQVAPKVNETFRRLTKTAYDVGHMLYNMEKETGSQSELAKILANIDQHFSKLCAIVQKHKQEVVGIVTKLKLAEKESLYNAKKDLTESIKKGKKVIDMIAMTSDPKKIEQLNLAALLEDAKQIAESAWYLSRDENNKDSLKVAVNEDLCGLISDYVHLEGNASSAYKLLKSTELGAEVEIPPPPPAPVFAPVLPKDVRQTKSKQTKPKEQPREEQKEAPAPTFYKNPPKYRSKSGSVRSLDSCSSDSSQPPYLQPNRNHTDVPHIKPNVQPVQPFAETQQVKQLLEGSQELVYISHIVSPHEFYVQRACHQAVVKEMIRHFRKGDTFTKPSSNHVAEGKMYLAYNKADKMWQRCRIVKVDKSNPDKTRFYVFFFDFGSSDVVDVDKLRLIPARASHPPPLAILCALANCAPISGGWMKEDSFLVHNIVDNKQVVIHVRHVHPVGNGNVKLECDVITYEDGISIAHALLFHERAKMPDPWLEYPQHHGIREKAKIFLSHDMYNNKTVEEVCISHVVNPDKFYVRKKHQQKYYEELTLDLEQDYSLNVNSGTIYLPEIGMSCCVHVPEQARGEGGAYMACGGWARGIVSGLPGRGRVAVALVDSGVAHVAHWTTLRYLHPKYTKLSALGTPLILQGYQERATECHLAGVTPLNKKWSAGALALMHKFSDRHLHMHVEERRSKGSVAVTLVDNSDPENPVCVNQEMVNQRFAITFGIYSFNKSEDLSDQGMLYPPPLQAPPRRNKPKPEKTILKRNTIEPQKIKAKDLEAKYKGPLRVEAKVLQYQSPSLIYVAIAQQQKTFYELFEEMQQYYSKNKPSKKENWEVGDRCCTICIQSKTWRRAVIVEINGENAKVFYSDFASVETLPISSLAELTPEFASIGDAAIKCHLCGVVPAIGEEWPSLTKEYLGDLLDSYKRIFITRNGSFKNKSMPVEIWVYHTIQGGALEPNRSEWRCLKNKIIEQGLGVPDKSEECRAAYSEEKPETGEDMLSFFKLTGNVNDWLQLEPIPTKPLPRLDSPQSDTFSDSYDQIEDMDASNVLLISDWLPPEPLVAKEFTAMPTYLDNEGVIYLHDVSQHDTLDVIRKALEIHFEKPDPKAKYYKWQVGEPCIARYYLDDRFYRGRVVEVNEEASSCLIHYIDYGNEEPCAFLHMRKSVALHEVPTQAHRCILHRIRPVDKKWERRTLDYIHKSIVEKHCHVKVMGDTINGLTPVTLSIDKLCINDHLVEFDMATYTDGSKAVIRKFVPAKREVKPNPPSVADSDPDYIIEDSSSVSDLSSVKARDWNEMLGEEDNPCNVSYITYPEELDDEFLCNIALIEDKENLELNIVHDDETTTLYEELMKDLQTDGESRPSLNGVFANKACIALFHQDMQWYRAAILEYSESKGMVKVRYVDYGNTDVIDLTDVKEIDPEWAKLSPGSVTVRLHGVKLNSEVDVDTIAQAYKETFLDETSQPFKVKVIKTDPCPYVELRDKTGELVYQNLFEKGIFQESDE